MRDRGFCQKKGNVWKRAIPAAAVFAAAFLLLLPAGKSLAKEKKTKKQTISSGISIQGTDVSGQTKKQADDAVAAYIESFQSVPITLTADQKSITVTAGDLGLTARNSGLGEQALDYGKTGNPAEKMLRKGTLKKKGKDFSVSFGADEAVLKQFLTDHNGELTTPAVDNGLSHENGTFTFVKGTEGTTLNIDEAAADVERFLSKKWDGKEAAVSLTTEPVEPKGTEEELSTVKDLLGTFTTDYPSSDPQRRHNIERAASILNGHILYPGDTLSISQTCGPFNAANGYESAGAYSGGEVVTAEGGGVCQVSTTAYNAVLLAELAIETRCAHSLPVSYVPYSFDAAIASSSDGKQVLMDMAFRNNKDNPVYIEALTVGTSITVNVYGKETRPATHKVSFENHLVSEEPVTNKYKADASLPVGTFTKTKDGRTGYHYQLIKIVTENGVETTRKVQNISNYLGQSAEYTVGVQSDDPQVTAAMQAAVATGDDQTIMNAIQQYAGVSVHPDVMMRDANLKALKDVAEDNPDDEKAQKAYNDAKAASDAAAAQAAQAAVDAAAQPAA